MTYFDELKKLLDVEVRLHGEWIEKPFGVVCSRCKAQAPFSPNGHQLRSDFCPECGASMRKEGEENG